MCPGLICCLGWGLVPSEEPCTQPWAGAGEGAVGARDLLVGEGDSKRRRGGRQQRPQACGSLAGRRPLLLWQEPAPWTEGQAPGGRRLNKEGSEEDRE